MEMNKKLAAVQEKRDSISKLKSEVQSELNTIFEEFIDEIFTKSSKLQSFSWTQYTPYFNDGSPCVFSANTDYLCVNDEPFEESNWYSEKNIISWGSWNPGLKKYEGRVEEPNPHFDKELQEITDQILRFLGNFDDEFFLNKFGDHVSVKVTRHGISVQDQDHE